MKKIMMSILIATTLSLSFVQADECACGCEESQAVENVEQTIVEQEQVETPATEADVTSEAK
ncbi:MAG: hypothetical protein V1855_03975 [bacterium]